VQVVVGTTLPVDWQAGKSESMPVNDAALTPAERLGEIAGIFAAGVLRLKSCRESAPESATSCQNAAPVKTSKSCRNPLDVSAKQSVHVTPC